MDMIDEVYNLATCITFQLFKVVDHNFEYLFFVEYADVDCINLSIYKVKI